jgi:hypothetical protein
MRTPLNTALFSHDRQRRVIGAFSQRVGVPAPRTTPAAHLVRVLVQELVADEPDATLVRDAAAMLAVR